MRIEKPLEKFRTYPPGAVCTQCGEVYWDHPGVFDGNKICPEMKIPTEDIGIDYYFYCLGCDGYHSFRTKIAKGATRPDGKEYPVWTFNGDMERPTFSPSLLIRSPWPSNPHFRPKDAKGTHHICHLFLRDGVIQYLGDCTHEFANRHIPLSESLKKPPPSKPA